MIYDDIIEKYCITNLPMGYMPTVAFLVGSGLLEYNAACGFDQFCKKAYLYSFSVYSELMNIYALDKLRYLWLQFILL